MLREGCVQVYISSSVIDRRIESLAIRAVLHLRAVFTWRLAVAHPGPQFQQRWRTANIVAMVQPLPPQHQQPEPAHEDAVIVRALSFSHPGTPPVIDDFSLSLPPGSRCLLAGANGAGKTTLLEVLAGKHMVDRDAVRILGRPAFYDLMLVSVHTLIAAHQVAVQPHRSCFIRPASSECMF